MSSREVVSKKSTRITFIRNILTIIIVLTTGFLFIHKGYNVEDFIALSIPADVNVEVTDGSIEIDIPGDGEDMFLSIPQSINKVEHFVAISYGDLPNHIPMYWFDIQLFITTNTEINGDTVGIHFEDVDDQKRMRCFRVLMPCGEEYFFTYEDFPSVNVMCRCGNPNHYVVKYGGTYPPQ